MKVIKQTKVYESMIFSTNVPETESAWSSGTTYSIGDIVYETTVGRYQSLANGNHNNQPSISPTKWVRIGPTNSRAMFDQTVSTQSVSSSPMSVVVETGIMDAMALINVDCSSVRLVVKNGLYGTTVYDQTVSMIDGVVDWYDYFFTPIEQQNQVIFRDIPPYNDAVAFITFSGSGTIKVGEVIFGTLQVIGGTQYGASSGIIDYSKKNTDEFGATVLVQGNYSKRINASVYVLNANLNKVQKFLYSIRATPCVFIATDVSDFSEALIVYGFYKDFNTEIPYPTHSICNIEIEGLI